MLSPLANWRENLEKIALGVEADDDDDDEEEDLRIYGRRNGDDSSVSDRRNSHSFAHSKSFSPSPMSNGLDSGHSPEIEQYKAEIKRLQESEAEIKALSVNYAALLKEKEDQISRLNKENGALKSNLDATSAAVNGFRNESSKAASSTSNALKDTGELSSSRQPKLAAQLRGRSSSNGSVSKHDILSNGTRSPTHDYNQGREKELADLLEEKNRYLAAQQAKHDLQLRELKMELEKERGNMADIQLKLQEEHRLNETFRNQLKSLQADKDKSFSEVIQMRNELNEKVSETRQLQMELNRHEGKDASDVGSLKKLIASLEKENTVLRSEKNELETSLRSMSHSTEKTSAGSLSKEVDFSGFPGREELQQSLQKLEKSLEEACRERDKARKELNRLKQHLLDKESEETEKMDQDSRVIEELRENNEHQRAQILRLEKALKQAIASQDEVRMSNDSELQKCKENIDELNRKLSSCISTIDAKNMEIQNLQTALGQYYAEIEAKERLERDLALAREECMKLSGLLKGTDKQVEAFNREKEDILVRLSQAEGALAEGNKRVNKLEEDNAKLRRALEQSMTRLNRMSVDSDFLVDRRIVIKLLVTYFQRNHSKEVLDLMVRMLGFSDEDKQRIGGAQQGAGKGVVRGVLGFPGRFVGGILGGSSAESQSNMASDNQSFADLWVDFLLKENDEKERREQLEETADPAANAPTPDGRPSMASTAPSFSRFSSTTTQTGRKSEPYGSEFSTVPLSSSDMSWAQRPPLSRS